MPPEAIADLHINFEPQATKETINVIQQGLSAYNESMMGEERYAPVRWIVRDAAGQVVGGLLGDLYFNWLYISILWVREDLRGQGIGSRLMAMAAEYAAAQGRTHIHVDTFDFQAPDFYRRLGYELHGELRPYGDGHSRYYFRKALPGRSPEQAGQ